MGVLDVSWVECMLWWVIVVFYVIVGVTIMFFRMGWKVEDFITTIATITTIIIVGYLLTVLIISSDWIEMIM